LLLDVKAHGLEVEPSLAIGDGALGSWKAMRQEWDTTREKRCNYTPHSIRATTATLLLEAGVDIIKVKELLGQRHVTTTQIYDKRRRSAKEGASHDVPI
jgi:integrase